MNQHIGLSRGGKTTKIHTIVDGLENPVSFQLSSGNIYDGSCEIEVLSTIDFVGSTVLADKAYNSIDICEFIENKGATYTIPQKSNTKEKWHLVFIQGKAFSRVLLL